MLNYISFLTIHFERLSSADLVTAQPNLAKVIFVAKSWMQTKILVGI
jgi:hypothetical protein